jgi:opacity protein-like surface antigen
VIRKGLFAAVMALLVVAGPLSAQHKAEITPFVGYQFGTSKISTVRGDLSTKGDMNYGAYLNVNIRPGGQLELVYSRQESELQIETVGGLKQKLTDMSIEYFHIGGLGYMQQGAAQPFGSFTLGATRYNPKESTIEVGGTPLAVSDEWRFSIILGAGVKYFASERVGLRLQGHLSGTFLDTGGGMFCGFGGCSLGLFGTGVLQGDLSGGLVIAI